MPGQYWNKPAHRMNNSTWILSEVIEFKLEAFFIRTSSQQISLMSFKSYAYLIWSHSDIITMLRLEHWFIALKSKCY